MTVAELIEALKALPQDAPVHLHWDGASRTSADHVWLAQDGHVSIGDADQPVYDDGDRIEGAPSSNENRYLEVREMLS